MSAEVPFALPLTSRDEYWLGFFRADGHILKHGKYRSAMFSQKLECSVKEYHTYIKATNPIGVINQPNTTYGHQHGFVSKSAKPAYLLDSLGVKSTLHPPLYSSKHFWRGMIDGDGCIFINSAQPILGLCGTLYDMEQFSSWCSDFLHSPPQMVRTQGRLESKLFRVSFKTNKAKLLGIYLYDEEYSAVPYKQEAALRFKRYNPHHVWKNYHV